MTEDKKKEFYRQTEDLITNEHLRAAIWTWIDQAITDACKRQREICAEAWNMANVNLPDIKLYNLILNAPSPKESEG